MEHVVFRTRESKVGLSVYHNGNSKLFKSIRHGVITSNLNQFLNLLD